MRIKLINCSTNDIKNSLDNIVESYDIQIRTVNIYVNFNKCGRKIDLFNINTLEPVFINNNSNIYLNNVTNEFIFLTQQNIEFINYILSCIDNWSLSSRNLMRSFLIYKCRKSLDNTNIVNEENLINIYDTLEEILQEIMNSAGIVFEEDSDN